MPSSRPFVSRFSFRVIDFPATSPGTVSSGPRIGPERRRNPPDRTRPLSGCEIGGTALLFCQVARSFPAFLFIIFVQGFSSLLPFSRFRPFRKLHSKLSEGLLSSSDSAECFNVLSIFLVSF